jgi:hypothetical protein
VLRRERGDQLLIEPPPSTRLRNQSASSTKRKSVKPETNMFMSQSSGYGFNPFKEDGPSNLLRSAFAAGTANCTVARSTSRIFNRRAGPDARVYCNLIVAITGIIPAAKRIGFRS